MNKDDYIAKFKNSKNYEPSDKDIQFLKKDIYKFIPILTQLNEIHNIKEPNELKSALTTLMNNIFENCGANSYIDSSLYELYSTEDILKDPSIIDREYNSIKDYPYTTKMFNADKTRSHKLTLIKALHEIKNLEAFAKQHNISAKSNIKNFSIDTKNKSHKELFQLLVNLSKEDSTRNKILLILEAQKKQYETTIKENQISSLQNLYDIFKTFNFTESYVAIDNINKRDFGIQGLDISEEDFKNAFSEETLKNLSVKDLCLLNAFWCNRLTKECARLNSAYCAIDSLDLWQNIIDKDTAFEIPVDSLIACMKKNHFLTNILKNSFNIHSKNVAYNEINGNHAEISLSKNYTNFYKKIQNSIQEDYENFFERYGLKNNDFFDNTVFTLPFVNLEMVLYRKKDTTLEPVIKNILDNNNCRNWGIIRNELSGNEVIDTLSENKNKVLLAFDIEGFNMPFRFHVFKKDLLDISKLNNPDCLIPEYQGYSDFIMKKTRNDDEKSYIFPANIVLPISKSLKKVVMNNSKVEGAKQNFWQHLYFLVNGRLPEHFSETMKTSGHKTISVRKPICYTSLISGKRFYKDKNNFIEVDNNDGR